MQHQMFQCNMLHDAHV